MTRYEYDMSAPDDLIEAARPKPHGLGGWLIFAGLGMVGSMFGVLKELFGMLNDIHGAATPADAFGLEFGVGVDLVLLIALLVSIGLFFMHKRLFPKFYIWVLVGILIFIGLALFADSLLGVAIDDNDIQQATRSIVAALIWVPYLMISKRVKNTFTE